MTSKKKNQYAGLPPVTMIEPIISKYWNMGKNDKFILERIRESLNSNEYQIGETNLRKTRESLGMFSARKHGETIESIAERMKSLRVTYPKAGVRDMTDLFWREHQIKIPRSLVDSYCKTYEPDLVKQRRANRLSRKLFWAAGLFDVVCVDQHDKWREKWKLGLHVGVEPMSGQILWLEIWHTNRNPKIVASYYLDWVKASGYMPLVTQSDPGTENYGIANAHTALRQWHDPNMVRTLSHRWMNRKKNIKPEIIWNQVRRRFSPGFEEILLVGINQGWYNCENPLENLVFRWVFIPWLQKELDAFRHRVNNFKKRRDKNKILPQGIPNEIVDRPNAFQVMDFRVKVTKEAIDVVRQRYAPRSDQVFDLVPCNFNGIISNMYVFLGSPEITRSSCWDVYLALLNKLEEPNIQPSVLHTLKTWDSTFVDGDDGQMPELLENSNPLANGPGVRTPAGSFYYGGVNHGNGLDQYQVSVGDEDPGNSENEIEEADLDGAFGLFSEDEDDNMLDVPM
ncbi:hypothetical protein EV359DRAFT_59244 [Lentinula novae-zelandiae]|nr:hypothetical protein EV359DRAFT_59244 [Lentinula novae-zelandiae]